MDSQSTISLEKKDKVCAIVANFTVLPIKESLELWITELSMGVDIQFAPYDQIIQSLLSPPDPTHKRPDFFVILIQLERWINSKKDPDASLFRTRVDEFLRALTHAAQSWPSQFIILICPSLVDAPNPNASLVVEKRLEQMLDVIHNIDVLTRSRIEALYPIEDYNAQFDFYSNILGQIPYSRLGFSNLGTIVARRIYNYCTESRKVIVVDCDNTLWSGIVGEEGQENITISEGHYALQKFLVKQSQTGRLVCLCSKNHSDNVFKVFDSSQRMLLRREHLTAWKINWIPKAENLRALSAELVLGLDSFIFIDDDPFECESVQALCPEVLTIHLPSDTSTIEVFLRNIWDLDLRRPTAQDLQRTRQYQHEANRKDAQRQAPSLEEFLATLELKVRIYRPSLDDLPRVAQLLDRTHQFNLNGIRRTIGELKQIFFSRNCICSIIQASDKYGDYGEIGFLVCCPNNEILSVETLLLSCRVLGRGVESKIAEELRQQAESLRSEAIQFDYYATGKNHAIESFLKKFCIIPTDGKWVMKYNRQNSPHLQTSS